MLGLDAEFARRLDALTRLLERSGHRVLISDGTRSREAQKALYERFRAGRGPLAAPPGRSCHEYGFAADIVVSPRDDALVQRLAATVGLRTILYGTTSNHVHVEWSEGCQRARGGLPAERSSQFPQGVADAQRQMPPASPGRIKGCP